MKLAWLTDIHLNFLDDEDVREFARTVRAAEVDAILLTGDIAEAPSLRSSLRTLRRTTGAEVFYVLGNHDFYRSDVDTVRDRCKTSPDGTYLHGASPHRLTDEVAVVGVDGWADGRFGRPRDSDLIFTDWHLIHDFREVDAIRDVDRRLDVVRRLADESASALRRSLERACRDYSRLLVLTHIPPFARAAGHDGSAFGQLWVPWLACKATGEVLKECAERHPDHEFEVLCGHTHVARVTHPRPNLVVRTGAATYRHPEIQRVWSV
jgi:3',5'-cyclic AMP phosphodiesterase CpdA